MAWIPMTEQKPPKYTKVLLTVKTTEWNREEDYHEVVRVVCKTYSGDKSAVAWMPLPEPYRKGEQNDEIVDSTDSDSGGGT